MLNIGYALLVYILVAGLLFKLGLLLLWSARLHAAHGDRHSYWEIFGMMFGPKSKEDMDSDLWGDFQALQRKNFVSNVIIGLGGIMLIIGSAAINRLWH